MSQPLVFPVYSPPLVLQVMQKPAPTHHSDESFRTVFIVLAIIVVISAIACFVGRLCGRRHNHPKIANLLKEKEVKQNHHSQRKEGDIEFGFDKRLSSVKVAANEEFGGGPNNKFGVDKRFPSGKGFTNEEFGGGPSNKFGVDKRFPSGKGVTNEEFQGPKSYHHGAAGGEGGGLEFGFDKRFPSGKETMNETYGGPKTHQNVSASSGGGIEFGFGEQFPGTNKGAAHEGLRGHKPIHNGQSKRVMRFAGDGK